MNKNSNKAKTIAAIVEIIRRWERQQNDGERYKCITCPLCEIHKKYDEDTCTDNCKGCPSHKKGIEHNCMQFKSLQTAVCKYLWDIGNINYLNEKVDASPRIAFWWKHLHHISPKKAGRILNWRT